MTNTYPLSEILLVEDNPAEAELARRAFEHNKIMNPVHHVSDGEEALEFISSLRKKNNPHGIHILGLILLDINIPKINGLEVLKQIKSDEHTKTIPAVMLTTSEETSDILKAYEYGANSYLVKPQNFHQFLKEVGTLGEYWLDLNKTLQTI